MWFAQSECVCHEKRKPCLLLLAELLLLWLLWCYGGSTVDDLGEGEKRIVVVLFVVFVTFSSARWTRILRLLGFHF